MELGKKLNKKKKATTVKLGAMLIPNSPLTSQEGL
jgi:hypothetical protein